MKCGLTKNLVTALVRGSTLKDGVLSYAYALNQIPLYGVVFPTARVHEFVNQGMEVGVASVIMIPNNPPVTF